VGMRAVVCLFALVCVAFAADAPECPTVNTPRGGTTAYPIIPGYKYSFEVDKSGAGRQLHLYVDVDDINVRQNQYIYFRGTSDATSARTADLNVYINVNQQSVETVNGVTVPNWFDCDLDDGSDSRTAVYPELNITETGDRIWFDLFPDCGECSETVEFSVEVAWLEDNSPFIYAPVELEDNLRTLVFKEAEGGYVNFYADLDANDQITASVVFPGTVDQSSEVVLYWNLGLPANSTQKEDLFPQDGTKEGNYLMSRAFTADTPGRWWIGAFVKDAGGLSDPEFTIKVGFNKIPCSGATATVASSLLLALIPLTLFFSRD